MSTLYPTQRPVQGLDNVYQALPSAGVQRAFNNQQLKNGNSTGPRLPRLLLLKSTACQFRTENVHIVSHCIWNKPHAPATAHRALPADPSTLLWPLLPTFQQFLETPKLLPPSRPSHLLFPPSLSQPFRLHVNDTCSEWSSPTFSSEPPPPPSPSGSSLSQHPSHLFPFSALNTTENIFYVSTY